MLSKAITEPRMDGTTLAQARQSPVIQVVTALTPSEAWSGLAVLVSRLALNGSHAKPPTRKASSQTQPFYHLGGPGGDSFFQVSVNAWLTAGIIPVFSLGNGGPACRTVSSPGDYTTVIGVGSTDSVDALSSFSSKGPSVGGILKPDISAPGESIRSAWYTGTNVYNTISGTSMAAPHVAGVVTLLLSAFPALSFAQVKSALIGTTDTSSLKSSGMTCGTTPDGKIPNNQHGYGRVNARAALNRVTGVTPAPTPAPAPKPPVTDRCAGLNELLCGEYLCDWNAATASCRSFT
ncbi:hypothetical protein FI667_g7543, partial [Globisporangium splendens]